MRRALLLALLLFPASLLAQPYEYVSPLFGTIRGNGATYRASVFITNLGKTRATISVGEIYPMANTTCQRHWRTYFILPGHTLFGNPGSCDGLGAFVMRSTEPLMIATETDALGEPVVRQVLTTAQTFFPASSTTIFPHVALGPTRAGDIARANVFFVARGTAPVTVTLRWDTACSEMRETIHTLEPNRLHVLPLSALQPICGEFEPIGNVYYVEVKANAEHYAIVSEVHGIQSVPHAPMLKP